MAKERFLIVRLGSMGDLVHAFPAVAVLRDSFPDTALDWVVQAKWAPLLEANPEIDSVIRLENRSLLAYQRCARRLRRAHYTWAVDFQGLFKSAALAYFAGAPHRVGFDWRSAREGGASLFYTQRVAAPAGHIVEQNLALSAAMGARATERRFALRVPREAIAHMEQWTSREGVHEYFVISPGGGWRSKCWPPDRYGELCRELFRRYGWRAVVNYGPGEEPLAELVRQTAAPAEPVAMAPAIPELLALLSRARIVIAADTGPLHLAVALGTPVVGLYGPTDPRRNGPYGASDIAIRNARPEETTHRRGRAYAPSMLSITVEQVLAAVERRLGVG